MSNSYLKFSFSVEVSQEEAAWIHSIMDEAAAWERGEEGEVPEHLAEVFPDLGWGLGFEVFRFREGNVFFISEEYGNLENMAGLLQTLLKRRGNLNEQIGFTYSLTGETQSGGAVRVFMDGSTPSVEYMNADHWLEKAMS